LAAWLQRLTCPRQRAFAPGHQARYPASYTRLPAEEPGTPPCFPAAFRPPAFAFWASCPAREFRPPYGRPTTPPAAARTRTGFPCSARVRPGWLRVPSLPRGRRCPRRPVNLPGRPPAASQRPAPIHPGQQPAPGSNRDEASARVHCRSPHTSLPLTCDPGRNGILGLSLSSAPRRAGPGGARQGGDRLGHCLDYVPGISQPPSTYSLTTCDLTSHERPVGRPSYYSPRPVLAACLIPGWMGLSRQRCFRHLG